MPRCEKNFSAPLDPPLTAGLIMALHREGNAMWTVKQVSDIAGVSVRTLHHYDAIGLLKPAKVTEAGYRLYDEGALGRLQSILLFRELGFPLQEIKSILDRPGFDPMDALAQQLQLLERKRRHVEGLISLARGILEKGARSMDFQAFDTKALEQYKAEAKGKWGHTKAYMEFVQKKEADIAGATQALMGLFQALGAMQSLPPAHELVQEKIQALQNHITRHFYTCTPQILQGLGQMYTEDPRFRENIDRAGGPGTAAFVQRAIQAYCQRT